MPDLVIGDDRHADALLHRGLVPGLTHGVAFDRSGLQCGGHLRGRRDRQLHIGIDRARHVAIGVIAGVQPARRQPVAQLVIMGGDREDHAHVEGLALLRIGIDHRLQRRGADRMPDPAAFGGQARLDLRPDLVRQRDGIAVEVEAERRDQIGLGAIADGRRDGLSRQHVRAVQLPADHPVEQDLPVRLRLERDVQPFLGEEALFLGDGQRRHVGQLDEAQLQVRLFRLPVDRGGRGCLAGRLAAAAAAGQRDRSQHRHDDGAPLQSRILPVTSEHRQSIPLWPDNAKKPPRSTSTGKVRAATLPRNFVNAARFAGSPVHGRRSVRCSCVLTDSRRMRKALFALHHEYSVMTGRQDIPQVARDQRFCHRKMRQAP